MRINYDLHDLRALLELGHQGGFNRAADALSITPSALSRRIAKLESAIGGRLVDRSTRSMVLTPLGDQLLRRIQPVLEQLDDGVQEAGRIARGLTGKVTVGCTASVAHSLFSAVVVEFHKSYPDVQIRLRDDAGSRVRELILNREVEFGVTTLSEPNSELVTEFVATDAFMLVLPPDHPLARHSTLHWSDLPGHRVLAFRPGSATRQEVDPILQDAGIALPWFHEVDHLSSMLGYLQRQHFIAVLPGLLASQLKGLVAVALTGPVIRRELYLAHRADMTLSTPGRLLWEVLADTIASAVQPHEASASATTVSARPHD